MPTPSNDMIGRVIDIVGIAVSDQGRSCKEHVTFCGVVLGPNILICLVKEEIFVEEKIETTIVSAYWVTDSVGRCRVGFLQIKSMGCSPRSPRCLTFDTHHPSAAIREKVHQNFGFCHATILDPDQPLNVPNN